LFASVSDAVSAKIRAAVSTAHAIVSVHPAGNAAASARAFGFVYTWIRYPAPHVSLASPEHAMLQSLLDADAGAVLFR
jgi:hypothetical protein